ncbi:MAG: helix-turn-helix domain-containing protein [Leptolyngbyaceae cyanobacterium bins.349]|nr:helix-turn-helix domain-containing protein [Leptolyngbyaceae cyanobacterium bins.349]
MTKPSTRDRTSQLQHLMQAVGFSSFKALSVATGISEKQLRKLRQGNLATLRVEALIKLGHVLHVSPAKLLTTFGPEATVDEAIAQPTQPPPTRVESDSEVEALRQEYDRLQNQLAQQQQELWQEFQQSSLQALESLLLQLPTAIYAAQQNPQVPAVKLIPLLRPIEHLLQQWGIDAIAPVGAEIPYDPQSHQLMEGSANPGDRVRVRYTGYRQGDRLLYRAKVSPIT